MIKTEIGLVFCTATPLPTVEHTVLGPLSILSTVPPIVRPLMNKPYL